MPTATLALLPPRSLPIRRRPQRHRPRHWEGHADVRGIVRPTCQPDGGQSAGCASAASSWQWFRATREAPRKFVSRIALLVAERQTCTIARRKQGTALPITGKLRATSVHVPTLQQRGLVRLAVIGETFVKRIRSSTQLVRHTCWIRSTGFRGADRAKLRLQLMLGNVSGIRRMTPRAG